VHDGLDAAEVAVSTVLVVDDDLALIKALTIGLRVHGYDVVAASDGPTAVKLAGKHQPDVLLVDLGLPGLSGIEVIQAVRGWSDAGIIVVSARDKEQVKVAALDAGADDYISKPFGIEELLARIRALLRRISADTEPVVIFDGVRVDLNERRVERDGELVHLTGKEWAALAVLAKSPGRLVTQGELLRSVWGEGYETESEYLRTLFARLRRKLEIDPSRPRHLLTEPGIGYRLEL
jgi:two-component system KDP operon response regulator KdpE